MAKLPDMGRPKTLHKDLPPRMTARKSATGLRYFYTTRAGGKIPLGRDKGAALKKWADLEAGGSGAASDTFAAVLAAYREKGLQGKAPKTQGEYVAAITRLDAAFGSARMGQIKPHHVRQYLDARTAKVAGNREIAVFSLVWNWARERGYTNLSNPSVGVRKNKEKARTIYVTDDEFMAVWNEAPPELQDALDLARLTGQREAAGPWLS